MQNTPFALYLVCPECGRKNSEQKAACACCDTKLISDDQTSHEWYLNHLTMVKRKRLAAMVGFSAASIGCVGFVLVLIFKANMAPGFPIIGCTALALIATYKSVEKFGYITRFFRSIADQPPPIQRE